MSNPHALQPPRESLARAGLWLVVLALGQFATLSLINAGPRVGYQHYVEPRMLGANHALALIAFAVEAVAVAWGIAQTPVFARVRAIIPGWRLWVTVLAFILTSATGSAHLPAYAVELLVATTVQLVHLGAVIMCARAIPRATAVSITRALTGDGSHDAALAAPPRDRPIWLIAFAVTLVAAFLAVVAYERHPHVPDEVVYLLQARYLAAGMLTLPLPPVQDAFNVDLMMFQADRWFSPVPPGWPFLLAAATAIGATWLLNPVLGGVNILLAWMLLRDLYPRRVARLGIVLLAASPWHLFMSMNIMTHTATLTAALAAAVATARLRRTGNLRWAVAAGTAIALVGLIRPLEAVPVAVLLGLWSLGAPTGRVRLLPSIVLTAVTIAVSSAVLPYNKYLTGSPTTFPIMAYTDATYGPGTNALGFGSGRGLPFSGLDPFPGHGPIDVLVNANFNAFQTNVELLGWATGSVLIVMLLLTLHRLSRADWYMFATIGSVIAIHSFYYFSGGPDFGARYWYLTIVPLIALASRGLLGLEERLGELANTAGEPRVIAGAGALIVVTLLVFVPWRAKDKYHHYRGMEPHAGEFASAAAPSRGDIVLVRGRRHPDYASAFLHNPLDLRDTTRTIFAWDRGPDARRELVASYPGRTFWILEGPTVTGQSFEMVAGPMPGGELLARQDSVIPWP